MKISEKLADRVIAILVRDPVGREMIAEGSAVYQLHRLRMDSFSQIRDLFLEDRNIYNSPSPLEEIESAVNEILFFNRRLAENELQNQQHHDWD